MNANYPGRPDHPDFWLISQAIIDQDAQADAGQDADVILSRMIDPASASYAAVQRGLRGEMRYRGKRVSPELLGAMWMDGFLAGMRVQQAKSAPAPVIPDDPGELS